LPAYTTLSEEQKEVLAKADRDADGNAVDNDGNLLLGETEEDDTAKILEEEIRLAGPRTTGKEYRPEEWT